MFNRLLRELKRGHKSGPFKIYMPSLEKGIHHGYIEIKGVKIGIVYEVNTIVHIEISGTLSPGTYDAYDPVTLVSAYVYVEWSPEDQPILIGVIDANVGKGYGYEFTGGAATVTLSPPYDSLHNHYIVIGNLGTETIHYKGFIDWEMP